ncbi:hypothetical protein MMC08_007174 [Hypocenomyce scalaris]|nr:hypothetical protein [Hypocenomyce scalaris]
MLPLTKILLLAVLATMSAAQQATILPATLPACAAQCTPLDQAQTGCVPPAAPVTNQATYQSCFCQSAYLSSLYASGASTLCGAACSAADMSSIQSWYQGFCPQQAAAANGGAGAPVVTVTTSVPAAPVPGTSSTPGSTSTSTSSSTSSNDLTSQDDTPNGKQRGWFSMYWRWVVMLIVLVLGLLFLTLAAVYLKRRYNRRKEAKELGVQPDLSLWGPHGTGVHDFGEVGEGYGVGREKSRGKQGVGVTVREPEMSRSRGAGRLKKSWL